MICTVEVFEFMVMYIFLCNFFIHKYRNSFQSNSIIMSVFSISLHECIFYYSALAIHTDTNKTCCQNWIWQALWTSSE